MRFSSSDVYLHEMPGGQYTNLKFQVRTSHRGIRNFPLVYSSSGGGMGHGASSRPLQNGARLRAGARICPRRHPPQPPHTALGRAQAAHRAPPSPPNATRPPPSASGTAGTRCSARTRRPTERLGTSLRSHPPARCGQRRLPTQRSPALQLPWCVGALPKTPSNPFALEPPPTLHRKQSAGTCPGALPLSRPDPEP